MDSFDEGTDREGGEEDDIEQETDSSEEETASAKRKAADSGRPADKKRAAETDPDDLDDTQNLFPDDIWSCFMR